MFRTVLLRAWFAGRAGRFRLEQPRARGADEVAVQGPDPVRVLVAGAGLATGYGVTTHDAAIAGPLARRLAERTGRGVVVHVRSAPLLPARAAVAHLGPDGARGYDAAVYAPCYLEAPFAPGAGMPRHGAAIQQHLLDTGGDSLRLRMLGIPRPSQFSRLDLAAAEAAARTNRAMAAQADRDARVRYVEVPAFTTVRAEQPFDERYYAEVALAVADGLAPDLDARPGR